MLVLESMTMLPPHDILSSWKEIAQYMGKGVRTVQRWERCAGLPVHRPAATSKGPVLAYRAELSAWVHQHSDLSYGGGGDSGTRNRELLTRALTLASSWTERRTQLRQFRAELHRLKIETERISDCIMEQRRTFQSKSKP